MATQAHCAYCFESLAASFERRQPLSLGQVEELWQIYHENEKPTLDGREEAVSDQEEEDDEQQQEDADMTDADTEEPIQARPAAISRLLNKESSASSSSSSLPSTRSSTSSQSRKDGSGTATPASSHGSIKSRSSFFTFGRRRRSRREDFPLFVTWNTVSRSGYKNLRGCIGTFEPQELEYGLRSYALTRYALLSR